MELYQKNGLYGFLWDFYIETISKMNVQYFNNKQCFSGIRWFLRIHFLPDVTRILPIETLKPPPVATVRDQQL